jgi:hypothetical protein
MPARGSSSEVYPRGYLHEKVWVVGELCELLCETLWTKKYSCTRLVLSIEYSCNSLRNSLGVACIFFFFFT